MKKLWKSDGKETTQTKDSAAIVRKIIAILLCFFGAIFLVSLIYSVIAYLIPYVTIRMFQFTGISIAEGLTFAEFSVGDTVVLLMMWFFPSCCLTGLLTAFIWKLACIITRKSINMLRRSFKTSANAVAEVTANRATNNNQNSKNTGK